MEDLKRPISNRGYTDSQIMSGIFNNLDIKVDAIFSSHSRRTMQTAQVFYNNLPYSSNLSIIKSIDLNDYLIDLLFLIKSKKIKNMGIIPVTTLEIPPRMKISNKTSMK